MLTALLIFAIGAVGALWWLDRELAELERILDCEDEDSSRL
jgi:hypothetical protein